MRLHVALVATIWIVVGCSVSGDPPSITPASVEPSREPATGSPAGPGTIDLPATVVDPVVADIARIAGVPVEQVTIVSAEPVTFPDGSLGCPEPGMVYIQVQVDGFKIVAEAGATTYDYRGSGPGKFRRCTATS